MEELHWIAARARVLVCVANARDYRLSRALAQWRQASAVVSFAQHEALLRAENASLASLLANARVKIVELTCEDRRSRVLWV